jgi:hypothetical protein
VFKLKNTGGGGIVEYQLMSFRIKIRKERREKRGKCKRKGRNETEKEETTKNREIEDARLKKINTKRETIK